jgi:TatD DNase family protein
MKLFDAHCHLHDERLADMLDPLMERAAGAGVSGFFSCGTDPGDWPDVLAVSQKYRNVIPAFGLHPLYIDNADSAWPALLEEYLLKTPSAIGEIGLDAAVKNYDEARQEEVFVTQLQSAAKYGLPVAVHCRKAWHRLIPLLVRHWESGRAIVIHSFSGTAQCIDRLAELGVYFSFSGSLTRSRNTRAHAAAKAVPPERLLIETDAPDIPPVIDHSIDYDRPNEPAALRYVCKAMAELRETSEEEIAALTWENACRLLQPILTKRNFKA